MRGAVTRSTPVSHSLPLVEELLPPPDPLEACVRFGDAPFLVLLDGAEGAGAGARYSFLAADPPLAVRSRGRLTTEYARGRDRWTAHGGDPLELVAERLAASALEPLPELPPFQGGAAGYLSYEWGAALERVPAAPTDDVPVPGVMLGLYDWVVAWDHLSRRAWIVATGAPLRGARRVARAAARLAWIKRRLRRPPPPTGGPARRGAGAGPATYPVDGAPGQVRGTFTRAGYVAAVERVIEHIRAGDIFQANLAQRFQAPLVGTPLEFYARLRARNPAPFAAYLDFDHLVLASASPERFLRLHQGSVETRPIKGTRPRGSDAAEDRALAAALATSPKDRAENAMIVDVSRNDLSRVCRPGTVRAPELFAVERYATVQHLVSTVVGELDGARSVPDLIRALLPGGSVTGAPKVRAMQLIAELEPTTRGVYCGAIGYWTGGGTLELSVAIRTCQVAGNTVYFHAGGGVVAESDPDSEYHETLDKARGMIAALAP